MLKDISNFYANIPPTFDANDIAEHFNLITEILAEIKLDKEVASKYDTKIVDIEEGIWVIMRKAHKDKDDDIAFLKSAKSLSSNINTFLSLLPKPKILSTALAFWVLSQYN